MTNHWILAFCRSIRKLIQATLNQLHSIWHTYPKYYFGILFGLYLYCKNRKKFMVVEEKHVFQRLVLGLDKWFREMLKWQMHTNLFRNPVMDDITGDSLLNLVHLGSVKKLMTDLFLLIYD